jgi:hypothetical protein
VSRIVSCPLSDFATAVDRIKQTGFELITGAEARELLCKLEQVEGIAPPADKPEKYGN